MKGQLFYVKDRPYENFWKAAVHAKRSRSWVQCSVDSWHLYQYASVDVKEAMDAPIGHWIDKKIQWIFENHKNPKLHWSGGTDSHAILTRSMRLGYRWPQVFMYTSGVIKEEFDDADAEIAPAYYWMLENQDKITDDFQCYLQWERNPREMHHLIWGNPNNVYHMPRLHFGFTCHDRVLTTLPWSHIATDINVSGHNKPCLFRLDNDWYWMQHHGMNDGVSSLYNSCAFFSDGNIPQLAVAQAYHAKKYFETHLPHQQGFLTYGLLSGEQKLESLSWIGRSQSFNEQIAMGKLGKGPHSFNRKHYKAIDAFMRLGWQDVVYEWKDRVSEVIATLGTEEDGDQWVQVHEIEDPTDRSKTMLFPFPQTNIEFCMKMNEDGMTIVDDYQPIIEEWHSRMQQN